MPESVYGQSKQTLEVSTGNVATVNDARDTTKPNNGALNPLGAKLYATDSSGRHLAYRYVRLKTTAPPTEIVGPVYWSDNTFGEVTANDTDGLGLNFCAGILLNVNITDGNFCYIQVFGFLADITSPGSTAISDSVITATGDQQVARIAQGVALTDRLIYVAVTAVAATLSDGYIQVEPS